MEARRAMVRRLVCLSLAVLVFGSGCARERESGPKLVGRVLVDGQQCRPASVFDFDVKFLSVEGEGLDKRSYLAEVQSDGTFRLHGSIGKGIPIGRYKVSIAGKVLDTNGKPTTRYLGQFTDRATPLEVEITEATREITIDLGKRTAVAS
jgi:hypothetical protein